MLLSKRRYFLGASILFATAVFWPAANSQIVDKQDWSSKIGKTSDIAELEWKVKFNIESAPSAPFAYVSSHGRDLMHGFHLTIDLYGNGFLVLTDTGEKSKGTQIVLLGQPITGTHNLEMSFRQSDKKIRWRSVEIFFDGVEVPFVSADPKRSIDLKNINFAPENSDASIESNAPKSGEIIYESLIVKTWSSSNHTRGLNAFMLLTSLIFLLMFLYQWKTRKHR